MHPLLRRRTDHGSAYGVESDVVTGDGLRLRTWRNGGSGPAVLVAPGLGTLPEAWPRLCDPTCGLDVVSWYQRGTFGSARPADAGEVDLEHHVDDALAVLDAHGLDRVVVAGWSMGATIACALAVRAPERVAGILGVAGVPDDTFSTIGAPLGVPAPLRRPLAMTAASLLGLGGPLLDLAVHRLPVGPAFTRTLVASGFMGPPADVAWTTAMLRRFALQDWGWYLHLAAALGRHRLAEPDRVRCPVVLLAGRSDVLTAASAVAAVPERIAQTEVVEVEGTHFLPLEQPDLCVDLLRDLVEHTGDAAGRP